MKRTQIYFPVDLYQAIETQARRQKVSVSEVIRQTMEKNVVKQKPTFFLRSILALDKGKRGPKNLSRDYKKILYGGEKIW